MALPIPVPNIEFTLRQVATLCNALGELHDRLPTERTGFQNDSGGCTDKNANDSLCTSLIHACNRLDDILKDDARWALKTDTHDTLLQVAQMEREVMKSRVLSENLGRQITKLQVYGDIERLTEVPDVRAPAPPAAQPPQSQISPAPSAPVKPKRRKK